MAENWRLYPPITAADVLLDRVRMIEPLATWSMSYAGELDELEDLLLDEDFAAD